MTNLEVVLIGTLLILGPASTGPSLSQSPSPLQSPGVQQSASGVGEEEEQEKKCSTLCGTATTGDTTVTNPGGGVMTIEFPGLVEGSCECETPPCEEKTKCKGGIKFTFDDHISWRTWVPHVTNGATQVVVPVCAQPPSGSNKPADRTEDMTPGCGNMLELLVEYWKKRLDPNDQVNIAPDLVLQVRCSSCKVNNCD